MIKNSFILLERIGLRKEKAIWNQGIRNWNDFISAEKINGISKKAKQYYNAQLEKARQALISRDSSYFAALLKPSEHWRLYDEFSEDALFLDIESDKETITVIGMHDCNGTKSMVGIIDKKSFMQNLANCRLIVTFNGRAFDIPVLENYFGIKISHPHIDLFHLCRRIGLSGGLKEVETKLGIKRSKILEHVRGHDAAELWRCFHATGDRDFLDMLVAYNEEDCANLQLIAGKLIPIIKAKTLG